MPMPRNVAVVGAGWAGLAAAVHLVDAGHAVTLYDAAHDAGGRARAFDWHLPDGQVQRVDNGQHIMIGAYREMLWLLAHLGSEPDAVLDRVPLTLIDSRGLDLRARALPAPLHLAVGVMLARGLTLRERIGMMHLMLRAKSTGFRIEKDVPVSEWLRAERQPQGLIERIWAPLCVAALNTPMRIASTQVFLNVLHDSLGAGRDASDFLLPLVTLDQLIPKAAVRYLTEHGAQIALGQPVERVDVTAADVTLKLRDKAIAFDGIVLAVPAHGLDALVSANADPAWLELVSVCAALTWQPITTVYLLYDRPIVLAAAMMALIERPADGAYGQWLFARGQLGGPAAGVAVVISAEGSHRDLEKSVLVTLIERQLREQVGVAATLVTARCVTEKRATFAAVPGLVRPPNRTASPRVTLAGDYTQSDYPATLEGALRSGRIAAQQLTDALRKSG